MFHKYNERGLQTERATFPASFASASTRPALRHATAVVSTQWHPTWALPTHIAEPGCHTTHTYSARGLLTRMDLPGNDSFTLEYDVAGRLTHVRHDGTLVDAQYMAGVPIETRQTAMAVLQLLLEEISTRLLPAAHAQVSIGLRAIPLPPADPMQSLGPFGGIERGYRSVAEALIRLTQCECDLNKGHDKPTVTTATKFHLTLSGHAFRLYSDQSYFTVPMNQYQQLVDSAVAQAGAPQPSNGRWTINAVAPLQIGYVAISQRYQPTFPSGMYPTSRYTVVVESDPCGSTMHDYNKVITMYPGWSKRDAP